MIIRFVQGTALTSRLIMAQEKAAMPFTPSHVEALTPDGGFYLGAHDNDGVQKRPVGYDQAETAHELLLTLDATPEQDAAFWKFLEARIGEPYDWRAIIGFVLPIHEHQHEHAICSALIALALRACDWFPAPLAAPAHLIDPRDLLLIISGRMTVPGI
jgi:hypothetical protein